jgi:hypothetical protein
MDKNKFGVYAGLWFFAHSALTPPECLENEHSAFQIASFPVISRTGTLRRRIINTESVLYGIDMVLAHPAYFHFPRHGPQPTCASCFRHYTRRNPRLGELHTASSMQSIEAKR